MLSMHTTISSSAILACGNRQSAGLASSSTWSDLNIGTQQDLINSLYRYADDRANGFVVFGKLDAEVTGAEKCSGTTQ